MFHHLQILIFFQSLFWIQSLSSFSVYDCKDQAQWPITAHDNHRATIQFQNWLFARQNEQSLCSRVSNKELEFKYGIGASIQVSLRHFLIAIEMGEVYRPQFEWLWADESNKCTLEINSIDCFSKPLSWCGHYSKLKKGLGDEFTPTLNLTEALSFSQTLNVDICTMSRLANKPILWTMGQFIHYYLRMRRDVHKDVMLRLQEAFMTELELPLEGNNSCKNVTIAVHIRGGQPDNNRKAMAITDFIGAIDDKVKEVELAGNSVSIVYITSDHLNEVGVISAQHMTNTFPRAFRYSVLPHYDMGNSEIEWLLLESIGRNSSNDHRPHARAIYVEYLADIEISVAADIYIGSRSNVYSIAASLRMARHPDRPLQDTCFMDSRVQPFALVCEGGTLPSDFQNYTNFWVEMFGGFNGGSPYWTTSASFPTSIKSKLASSIPSPAPTLPLDIETVSTQSSQSPSFSPTYNNVAQSALFSSIQPSASINLIPTAGSLPMPASSSPVLLWVSFALIFLLPLTVSFILRIYWDMQQRPLKARERSADQPNKKRRHINFSI